MYERQVDEAVWPSCGTEAGSTSPKSARRDRLRHVPATQMLQRIGGQRADDQRNLNGARWRRSTDLRREDGTRPVVLLRHWYVTIPHQQRSRQRKRAQSATRCCAGAFGIETARGGPALLKVSKNLRVDPEKWEMMKGILQRRNDSMPSWFDRCMDKEIAQSESSLKGGESCEDASARFS